MTDGGYNSDRNIISLGQVLWNIGKAVDLRRTLMIYGLVCHRRRKRLRGRWMCVSRLDSITGHDDEILNTAMLHAYIWRKCMRTSNWSTCVEPFVSSSSSFFFSVSCECIITLSTQCPLPVVRLRKGRLQMAICRPIVDSRWWCVRLSVLVRRMALKQLMSAPDTRIKSRNRTGRHYLSLVEDQGRLGVVSKYTFPPNTQQ